MQVWVAFAGVVCVVIGAVWKLSAQLTKAITKLDVRDEMRAHDIARLELAVEKIQVAISAIAVDRTIVAALERRVGLLETWYDELRRGIGRIVPYEQAPTASK